MSVACQPGHWPQKCIEGTWPCSVWCESHVLHQRRLCFEALGEAQVSSPHAEVTFLPFDPLLLNHKIGFSELLPPHTTGSTFLGDSQPLSLLHHTLYSPCPPYLCHPITSPRAGTLHPGWATQLFFLLFPHQLQATSYLIGCLIPDRILMLWRCCLENWCLWSWCWWGGKFFVIYMQFNIYNVYIILYFKII